MSLQKRKLYTETLLSSGNITTSNAQTLSTLYPSIINNDFDTATYRSSVPMQQSAGTFPLIYYANASTPVDLGFVIEFKFTGQVLEIAGQSTFYVFSLMVNDVMVVKNFNSNTSSAGSDVNDRLWTKVDLGANVTDAHVRLYFRGRFAGVSTNGSLSLFTKDRLKVISDGDSIFEGTGSGGYAYTMMSIMSYLLDLDLYNSAVGGSGFISLGNQGQPNMVDRFDTYVLPYDCDIFLSGGGLNDGYTTYNPALDTALVDYFDKVYNAYIETNTQVVIVSPYEPNGSTKYTHQGILTTRDKEKELCRDYGFYFIDMIDGRSYDDMGNIIQDSFTNLGGITDFGRNVTFNFDGTHPNEEGHKYAGRRLATEVHKLLNFIDESEASLFVSGDKEKYDSFATILDQTAVASSLNVGRIRYYTDASFSYYEVCMQTGASNYSWITLSQQSII